jgi:2-polyprenyl-3-methyl-5-hydroxy-6-metoxy-1,4-benzoquinol methylase
MESRKKDEADFHDNRELDRKLLDAEAFQLKYPNLRVYATVKASQDYQEKWMREYCGPGQTVLDFCCGAGELSLKLAGYGAFVYGVDISEESVKTTRKRLADGGFSETSQFQVMDAEALSFADSMFDVIVCSGVLHHLDLDLAYRQLCRVLKPGGRVICIEALGYNPLINLYRRFTPNLRTEWEAQHILKMPDVARARVYFRSVEVDYFHLFSIAGVFFRKSRLFPAIMNLLDFLDGIVLKLPLVRLMAWQMIFELSGPRK